MQYTLRRVPKAVDAALRRRAQGERKTLNEVVIEVLREGLGLAPDAQPRRSVRDILGARAKDPELEAALEDQRRIDPDLWR